MMPLPYCVYILFSEKDKMLYTGYTSNIEKRLENHNSGGTKSTANRGPFKLIFCEFYLHKIDAIHREKYLKTTVGKRTTKLLLRKTMERMGYAVLNINIESD